MEMLYQATGLTLLYSSVHWTDTGSVKATLLDTGQCVSNNIFTLLFVQLDHLEAKCIISQKIKAQYILSVVITTIGWRGH